MPKARYVKNIDIDKLQLDIQGCVVRRSRNPASGTFHEATKILREDSILDKDLLGGLSMNLLGGRFKDSYIKFNPFSDGQKDWSGGDIDFFNFRKLFEIKSGGAIYYHIAQIHKKDLPYKNLKNDATKKLIAFLKLEPEVDNTYLFNGTTEVKHSPTNLNYWHVELILKDANGKQITDKSKTWKEDAMKLAYSQIITAPVPMQSRPELQLIGEQYYVTNNH